MAIFMAIFTDSCSNSKFSAPATLNPLSVGKPMLLPTSEETPESDSDSGTTRSMTDEEVAEYYRHVEESEGFDVPNFPGTYAFCRIDPIKNFDSQVEELKQFAAAALREYNSKNNTDFEVMEIEKVNGKPVRGMLYYITFKVKPANTPVDSPITVFQAIVRRDIPACGGELSIELCKPKPK